MRKAYVLMGFFFILIRYNTYSQNIRLAEKGLITGFGHGTSWYNLPEGTYRPLFLIGHFGIDLVKKEHKIYFPKGLTTAYFEPQFNLVFITRSNNSYYTGFESGINIGLQQMYAITGFLHVYVLAGLGPHYYSIKTEKQAPGFLFSDNLGGGVYVFCSKTVALNLGFRIRHMSNANTRFPNHGINTYDYHWGLSFFLK